MLEVEAPGVEVWHVYWKFGASVISLSSMEKCLPLILDIFWGFSIELITSPDYTLPISLVQCCNHWP